jgi:hypothetical protein
MIAIALHLFADFILQNDWMAKNKTSLKHPASWTHGGIHFLAMAIVFPLWVAVIISILHVLFDTRKPLEWWRKFYRKTMGGEIAIPLALWEDQTLHIVIIAMAWTLLK